MQEANCSSPAVVTGVCGAGTPRSTTHRVPVRAGAGGGTRPGDAVRARPGKDGPRPWGRAEVVSPGDDSDYEL